MRRAALGVLAIVVVVASLSSPRPVAADDGAGCGVGSWIAGSVDLCEGVLVHRDYVYDDHGASLFGLPDDRAEGLYAAFRTPSDAYGDLATAGVVQLAGATGNRDNTADLVALRVGVDGDELAVAAELNTMFEPDDAMVIVGLDLDNDLSTAASPAWPEGVLANPFLLNPAQAQLGNQGLDEFIVLRDGDPDTNVLEGRIPRPPGDTWRLQAVVAQDLPHFPAGPVVMNVAFRGLDERGHWWENAQAKALATNDISAYSHTVAVGDLTGRVTRRQVVPPGLVRQRVYVSDHPVGEGLRPPDGPLAKVTQATGSIDFLGRHQPYGLVVPDAPGPHGVQFVLHGLGENHSALLADPAGAQNPPPIALQMGIPFNRITVVPLARGPGGFYVGPAHRDFLDVLADLQASYPVDDDRIFSGGMSMGGYGALRMATLHPDLFAAAVTWVAFTGDTANGTPAAGQQGQTTVGGVGNIVELLGNLRNVPLAALYSGEDELIHVNEALAVRDRLTELELESAYWLHHPASHSSFASIQMYDREAAWSDGRVRRLDPADISYTTDLRFFDPDLGLAPDGAYWIDGIVPAGEGLASVDARSQGCRSDDVAMARSETPGAGPGPWAWTLQAIEPGDAAARPVANHIELRLHNVSSVTVEVGEPTASPGSRGACLRADDVLCHVVTDVDTTVRLSDGRSLVLGPGEHECVLSTTLSGPTTPSAGVAADPVLPDTGGGLPAAAALLVVAGTLSGRRRGRGARTSLSR